MIEVRKDVLAATGGKQVPWDHSALTGEFYFQKSAAASVRSATGDKDADALQQRMRSLEDEVNKKSDAEQTSNIVALAQARERLRQLTEANQADQQKIFDRQYETGSSGDADSRRTLSMEIGKIQMQMVRRGQEQKKLREQITTLGRQARHPRREDGRRRQVAGAASPARAEARTPARRPIRQACGAQRRWHVSASCPRSQGLLKNTPPRTSRDRSDVLPEV